MINSKNIFTTNLFSWARLTLGLRFVLPGRGFSAKLRPLLPTYKDVFFFGITILTEVVR